MPLRLGIFAMACLTVVYCFLMLVSTGMQDLMRPFVGGFCRPSRIALHICAFTGVVFGICGALGAWYCKRSYVFTFNLWQAARILAYAFIYYKDVPLLTHCESWVNSIDASIKENGWNELMYKIAMSATCPEVRTEFWICSIFALLVLMYVTWCTHLYLQEVGKVPKHLLKIPKDLSSGAWYAHSLGEKQWLFGKWGQEELPPPMAKVPPGGPGLAVGPPAAPGMMPYQTVPPGMMPPRPSPGFAP